MGEVWLAELEGAGAFRRRVVIKLLAPERRGDPRIATHHACDRYGKPLHLVHRDIASDNVLISRSGAVYLGDFGVARARGNTEITDPGSSPKGKSGYMAPEQAMGGTVTPATDIYALGKVLAE